MNILSRSGTSDYQNRTVTIKVTGVRQQSVIRQGSYQLKVPYSRMSQAMQTIHRRGGQIASVQVESHPPAQTTTNANADKLNQEKEAGSANNRENNSSKKSSKRKRQ